MAAPQTRFAMIANKGRPDRGRWTPARIGLIGVVIIVIGTYFAFTKANPFANPYEFTAVFSDVNELKVKSPVRIAGVNIGKVTEVEPMENGSGLIRVKMELQKEGLPVKRDAEVVIRSRLFLEGNYFVDLHPGSPSAPELKGGQTLPVNRSASPVQFGEVLTALQRDTREDLRTFLREFSSALDKGGAEGFNEAIRHWERSYRGTAIVSEATLGEQPHDLHKVLKGQGTVFGALARDEEALKDLITSLNTTAAAFARQEDNLSATIPALRDVLRVGRPALQSLNSGLPSLRAFARDALPAARSSVPTLDAQLPFVKEARGLVGKKELRGLARDLRITVPSLALLNRRTALSLEQTRALSSCQNNVVLPFSKKPIPNPDFPGLNNEPWFELSPRALVGLSGESRLADANSPFFRIQGGGGAQTLVSTGEAGEQLISQSMFPIEGVRPVAPDRRPVFRPGVPCETQEVPDLNAARGDASEQTVTPNPRPTARQKRRMQRANVEFRQLADHLKRLSKNLPTVDPTSFDERGERREARRQGLEIRKDGTYAERKKEPSR